MKEKYLILYAHNIPVEGETGGAIYDLQHGRILYIPNILVSVLKDCRCKPYHDILEEYTPSDPNILMRYFTYLLENNWIFATNHPELYPEICFDDKEIPNYVYNAIVESGSFLDKALKQLESCCCWYVEFRIIKKEDLSFLINCLPWIKVSGLRKYRVIFFFKPDCKDKEALSSFRDDIRFVGAFPYAPQKCNKLYVSLSYFREAQRYDTYRYKKVYIDKHGCIYNTPEDTYSLGNISKDKLKEICFSNEYKKMFFKKDDERTSIRYAIF